MKPTDAHVLQYKGSVSNALCSDYEIKIDLYFSRYLSVKYDWVIFLCNMCSSEEATCAPAKTCILLGL